MSSDLFDQAYTAAYSGEEQFRKKHPTAVFSPLMRFIAENTGEYGDVFKSYGGSVRFDWAREISGTVEPKKDLAFPLNGGTFTAALGFYMDDRGASQPLFVYEESRIETSNKPSYISNEARFYNIDELVINDFGPVAGPGRRDTSQIPTRESQFRAAVGQMVGMEGPYASVALLSEDVDTNDISCIIPSALMGGEVWRVGSDKSIHGLFYVSDDGTYPIDIQEIAMRQLGDKQAYQPRETMPLPIIKDIDNPMGFPSPFNLCLPANGAQISHTNTEREIQAFVKNSLNMGSSHAHIRGNTGGSMMLFAPAYMDDQQRIDWMQRFYDAL